MTELKLSKVKWPSRVTQGGTSKAVMRFQTQIPTNGCCFHDTTIIHCLQTSWQRPLAVSPCAFLLPS